MVTEAWIGALDSVCICPKAPSYGAAVTAQKALKKHGDGLSRPFSLHHLCQHFFNPFFQTTASDNLLSFDLVSVNLFSSMPVQHYVLRRVGAKPIIAGDRFVDADVLRTFAFEARVTLAGMSPNRSLTAR